MDSYETIYYPDFLTNNVRNLTRKINDKKHKLFVNLNHEIDKKNKLGVQYSLSMLDANQYNYGNLTSNSTNSADQTHYYIDKVSRNDNDFQTISLNYEYLISKDHSVFIIGDYSNIKNKSIENISENDINKNTSLNNVIRSQSSYNVYVGKVDYKGKLLNDIDVNSGLKLSKVNNKGLGVSEILNFNIQVDDVVNAAYLTLNKKLKSLKIKGGLRYEQTNTVIKSKNTIILDSTYSKWFPSLLVTYKFSDKLNITSSYSEKISRPSYGELSTNVVYYGPFSYKVGNPMLRPTISKNIDLSVGLFRNLSINAGYRYEKDARILSAVNDESQLGVVKYTPLNIRKAEYFLANVDYNYSGKKFNSTFSLGIEKPFVDVPFLGTIERVRDVSWYCKMNNDFSITSKTSVFSIFSYKSRYSELITIYDKRWKLSVGLNTSFFEDKLKLSILANDIFNSSDGAWNDQFNNIKSGLDADYDITGLRISLKYNFNDFKGGLLRKTASRSEMNRL